MSPIILLPNCHQIKVGSGQDVIEPLEDILHLIDGRVPLLIELKDQSRQLSQTDGRLEQATIDALSLYHGPVAVMSFNPYMIATMAQLSSELPLGLTTGGFMDPSWGIRCRAYCAFIPDRRF